jgi:predicted O-methyltransferase YrrM
MDNKFDVLMGSIYQSGQVLDDDGEAYPLNSAISPEENRFLVEFIGADPAISRTLEVGCAYGLSSLAICRALSGRDGAFHTIIDPFQHVSWSGIGIAHLDRCDFDGYRLIEEPSEIALPQLAAVQPGGFDLVFIDGWHTFDHTLIDLFYAMRLVRVGGYVIVDDCDWPAVANAIACFAAMPHVEIMDGSAAAPSWGRWQKLLRRTDRLARAMLPQAFHDRVWRRRMFSTMTAIRKTAEDSRSWDWYRRF